LKRSVLIFSVDAIPMKDRQVSGGGLRAWSLGEALKGKGHDVVYSIPEKTVQQGGISGELAAYAFRAEDLRRVIRKVMPDVILFEQWGLATYLEETSIPVVMDLHGSLILENYFRKHGSLQSNVAAKIKTLGKADYVICPSERQKSYFLPWLMLSGFQLDREHMAVIPVSLSPKLPRRKPSKEVVIVFGGGLWPWINPFPCLHLVIEEIGKRDAGRLKIFSQQPVLEPVLPKDASLSDEGFDIARLKTNPRVDILGFVPHERLIEEYAGATAAVDLYQWNKERELAFSTRTVEYLWCGLPVLHADYSELSDPIGTYKAGWCLDPKDSNAIRGAIEEIFEEAGPSGRYSRNAKRLVKDRFTWDRTIQPLDTFVSDPSPKISKQAIFDLFSLEFDRIEEELESENQRIKGELVERNQQIESLKHHLEDEVHKRDQEIWSLNKEIRGLENRLVEEIKGHTAEKETLRNSMEGEIRNIQNVALEKTTHLDGEIYRLNQEIRNLMDEKAQLTEASARYKDRLEELEGEARSREMQMGRLNETVQGQEAQIADLHGLLSQRDQELRERQGEVQSLADAIKALEHSESLLKADLADRETEMAVYQEEMARRNKEVKALKNQVTALESIRREVKDLRHTEGALRAALKDGEREIAELKEITNRMAKDRERVKQLEGVLNSIQNRFLYRSYKSVTYRLKRLCFQYPRLYYLLAVNFITNAYMSRWCKKHETKIFPAQ
jgi:glycosyltransferase involved in cell wall biosynthesis/peptidoglycan hydrolase CwlO-like protein